METKRIDDYFKKAKQLPLAMKASDVKALVSLKGVTSPPNKSWWNLNNLIIMTSSTLLISLALSTLLTTTEEAQYKPPLPKENKQIEAPVTIDSTEKLIKPIEVLDEPIAAKKASITPGKEEVLPVLVSEVNVKPDSGYRKNTLANVTAYEDYPVAELAEVNEDIVDVNLDIAEVEEDIEEVNDDLEEVYEEEENEFPNPENISKIDDGESKSVKKQISADGVEWFDLSNKFGNITISNWNNDNIEVTATFTLKADEEEDQRKALEDFEMDLKKNNNRVVVKTNWDDIENCNCKKGSKKKLKTDKGEKIEIEKFNIVYEVKLPKKMNLQLSNSYADIKLEDVGGDLIVKLFKGNISAGNISKELNLSVKYGDASIGDFTSGELVFFKSNVFLGKSTQLDITSNYSDIKMEMTKQLNLTAFKSDLNVKGKMNKLEGNFKYGDLILNDDINEMVLMAFKSDIIAQNFKSVELKASYCDFKAGNIAKLKLENAFKSDFVIKEIGSISGDLKYSPLEMDVLKDGLSLTLFKGKLEVKEIKSSFKELDLITKYTNVDLKFDAKSKFELDAEMSYTDFKIPEELTGLELNNDNRVSNHLKGIYNQSSTKTASKVNVNSFQGNLNLQ